MVSPYAWVLAAPPPPAAAVAAAAAAWSRPASPDSAAAVAALASFQGAPSPARPSPSLRALVPPPHVFAVCGPRCGGARVTVGMERMRARVEAHTGAWARAQFVRDLTADEPGWWTVDTASWPDTAAARLWAALQGARARGHLVGHVAVSASGRRVRAACLGRSAPHVHAFLYTASRGRAGGLVWRDRRGRAVVTVPA
ncbi:uncharacterized protein V1510DRAFT_401975 [Dipodascopsis tothii]|uniref:uncharacterized protein n=1 Tax=Dipodascopsis tothii TaxID=44089 RepID=UPI0034CE42B2